MKSKKKVWRYVLGLILIIGLCGFGGYILSNGITKQKIGRASNIDLGLDLAGGVSITYEVQGKNISDSDMKDTVYKLQKRVETYSTEAEVYREGDNRINIEIPGVTDANKILDELGQPGTLSFMTQDGKTALTGSNVKSAEAKTIDNNGTKEYVVALNFDAKGTKAFAKATKANVGKSIYIVYDKQIVSAPTVKEAITKGECSIDGMANYEEAENLASSIRIGALPVELKELRSNVVSAKLGDGAINTTVKAGIVGVGIIAVFMIALYLLPGVVASLALAIYILMMVLALNGFNITLTLPGLAGIILGIGMAVDANVIIYSRIKEEISAGKSVGTALKSGFSKAASAIIDGNVTTLIAVAVLMWRGTGTVKGFAQTLGISVLISMFTALVVSRFLVYAAYHLGLKSPKLYGKARTIKEFDFVKTGKKYVAVAGIIIVAGLAFLGVNKNATGSVLNFDLEFSGGTASTITFKDNKKLNADLEKKVVKAYEKISKSTSVQSQKVQANNQMVIKSVELSLKQREAIEKSLKKSYGVKTVATENISSTISNEMQQDAVIAVVIASAFMLVYIAFRFKDVKFGASAIVALLNDLLVVFAAYSILKLSVGGTFIACMLTILGYSINSTIVIFDRIRENIEESDGRNLKHIVNASITQTFTRTINSSFTTFVMVFVLFLMGSSSLREFALTLMVGVVGGAFSSVFLTGPLWFFMRTRIGKGKEEYQRFLAKEAKIEAAGAESSVVYEDASAKIGPSNKKKRKKKKKGIR
ncbi:MAG: protein translocase subunit SecD [Anaerostipes sp.]|jgi:SecD/SecF fusion protein